MSKATSTANRREKSSPSAAQSNFETQLEAAIGKYESKVKEFAPGKDNYITAILKRPVVRRWLSEQWTEAHGDLRQELELSARGTGVILLDKSEYRRHSEKSVYQITDPTDLSIEIAAQTETGDSIGLTVPLMTHDGRWYHTVQKHWKAWTRHDGATTMLDGPSRGKSALTPEQDSVEALASTTAHLLVSEAGAE